MAALGQQQPFVTLSPGRLFPARSSHSLVFYNILGVVSHCGVTLDETMLW